ncbi:MAG TPA: 30S ribosome-binding factor RbfA [Opitutaceae bacterium]|nr:30S ribosome-binding factor RbfA [Opitutaceae bacterium]
MSNRTVRINELLQREISHVLHTKCGQDAVLYTITGVDIASDLRTAKVFFSMLRKDADPGAGARWLRSKVGLISEHLRRYVQLRYLPKLEFVHDESPDRAERVLRLLDEIVPPAAPGSASTPPPAPPQG